MASEVSSLGQTNCGIHSIPEAIITSTNYRYPAATLYGNYLSADAEYFGQFTTMFAPVGPAMGGR